MVHRQECLWYDTAPCERERDRQRPGVTVNCEAEMTALDSLRREIAGLREGLLAHPIYTAVDSPERLRRFMEGHVFAVWDFMSLAKRLQRELTCVDLPWTPPRSPAAARFINELVTAEESDLGPEGVPMSHFELYLTAMAEVGASTAPVRRFVRAIGEGARSDVALAAAAAPPAVGAFVTETLACAQGATTVEVAAAFLFGREDVIPEMFERLLERWDEGAVPHFRYYLRRHIDLDGEAHGPLAERLLKDIAGDDTEAWRLTTRAARRAIGARIGLWDRLLESLEA